MQNTPRTPKTVALYARVSTKDRQEAENQLRELREYCAKQAWPIAGEYVDHESGSKPNREQFKQLFTHAHQKRFDTVVFWALDRFSREGTRETLNYLHQLESVGVAFVSYTEPYVNSLGIWRDAIIGFLASLAKQEVTRHSERVKAGMARARAQGKRISRSPLEPSKQADIARLHQIGTPKRAIARRLGIDIKTVRKYIAL